MPEILKGFTTVNYLKDPTSASVVKHRRKVLKMHENREHGQINQNVY